jgi:predicted ATPase
LAYGTILRGWALTMQGEGAEGVAQMRQGLVAYQTTGAELQRPYFLSLLAEAYQKGGQPEEGLQVLAEALAIAEKTGGRSWDAELNRRKGELLLIEQSKKHKVDEAVECFQNALNIARRQQAKSFELRAAMSLSRLWQQQGKKVEAHQLLSDIYGWFTEGFDTADLKEAKVLLDEMA